MGKEKNIDVDKIRQHNISKEMIKIGVTPHLVELSKNGDGFKVLGPITKKQKRYIERFASGQYEIWTTINEIVKHESGNWTKFCRENDLPRDFKKSLKKYLSKSEKMFSPFGLRQTTTDKHIR